MPSLFFTSIEHSNGSHHPTPSKSPLQIMFAIPDIKLNRYGKPARIMFLAPYAPDAPDFSKKPYTGNGGYPQYHYNIYKAIKDIGYDVISSSKPYSVQFAKGNVDYVFSLMNRFEMSQPEIFISSYCEFIQVPYLGAPPNIRAIAEDKLLTKLIFRALGLNIPNGFAFSKERKLPLQEPFSGPYFVKKRFGAASGGIREDSICSSWKDVKACSLRLMEEGHEVLVEQYCEGIDVTVPVLGGEAPIILGYVQPKSDKPGSIITEDLKLHDHLGYQIVSVNRLERDIANDVQKIWNALGPIDYFRVDYRIDFKTGERRILEMNICCHLGKSGSICLAASKHGYSQADLLKYIIAYSMSRQKNLCQYSTWLI